MREVKTIYLLGMIVSAVSIAHPPGKDPCTVSPLLQNQLQRIAPQEQIAVLILLRDRADVEPFRHLKKREKGQMIRSLKDKAERDQRTLRNFLKNQGVEDIKSLWINNSLAVSADSALIYQLAQFPEIEEIKIDTAIHLGATLPAETGAPQWHLNTIEAPFLWSLGFDGTGIVIAGMDTGVDMYHPDLAERWRGGQNSWKDVYGQHPLPYDYHGHGTATMGIMTGGNYSGTTIGVAPGAQWIAVKIFDDHGNAPYSKIHEGFQWLLDPDGNPDTPDAPDIVNNSWGLYLAVNQCINEFKRDIDTLKAAGIAVVFAAGNAGAWESTSVSPANNPGTFSVGAIDETGTIASFSSRGPSPCSIEIFPSLSAPGSNILTADLTAGGTVLNSYAYVSGTSYAAAVVSGGMALLLSAFPDMDVTQLEKSFLLSSDDRGDVGPDNFYGHGIINTALAYEFAVSVCPGDFQKDYGVDIADLMILMSEWLVPNCSGCKADLNNDQIVNVEDFGLFSQNYGKSPCPLMCSSDVNRNYEVGISDLMILASEWLMQECMDCPGDINQDSSVDYMDVALFSKQYGKSVCR